MSQEAEAYARIPKPDPRSLNADNLMMAYDTARSNYEHYIDYEDTGARDWEAADLAHARAEEVRAEILRRLKSVC